jgi:hypothetical protein
MSDSNFSHDMEGTLRAACALVSTDRVDGERLDGVAALDDYLDRFGSRAARSRATLVACAD